MTQQTDAAALNGTTLSQNYFYNADASASGAGSTNGVVSYNGTVTATSQANISGTISNAGNGFFTITNSSNVTTEYQILGSTADGQNLVFETVDGAGNNSGPYFVLSASGTEPSGPLDYNSNNPYSPPTPACFVAGTLIMTEQGERPIETLCVGEKVITSDGRITDIKWSGHRSIDCTRYPFRDRVLPVRISKGAIADDIPSRDLIVSPHHAVAITTDVEYIVPAMRLVNGSTIQTQDVDAVEYWHIELDHHDLIVANGMPAETYIDVGNRSEFDNETGSIILHPEFKTTANEADCRPRLVSGEPLMVIRRLIEERAASSGWAKSPIDNRLRVLVDDEAVAHIDTAEGIRFDVPQGARSVTFVSETFEPRCVAADSLDARKLGCHIGNIVISDADDHGVVIGMDDARLRIGFHEAERNGSNAFRWSDGNAKLTSDLWSQFSSSMTFSVTLARPRAGNMAA